MEFPKDYNDFIKNYSFADSEEVYTDGCLLIPVYIVDQMIRHYFDKDDSSTELHYLEDKVGRIAFGKDMLICPGISINAEHTILTAIGCDGQVISYDLAPNVNGLDFIEVNGVKFIKENSK
jgi:hypothetical protein